MAGPSLTPGGEELFLYSDTSLSKFTFTNTTTYTLASNPVPPANYDSKTAQLSKDGLELYWTLAETTSDSSALFKLNRTAIASDFINPVKLNNNINSAHLNNFQASYASLANVMVWVRNDDNYWTGNELYIAQAFPFSAIDELSNLNSPSKQLSMIVDLMGRKTEYKPNTVLIYIYSDGTIERKLKIE